MAPRAYLLRQSSTAENLLIVAGLSITTTRKLVLETILINGYTITNNELYCLLRNKMSRSVIYRTIQLFIDRKLLGISPLCGKSVRFYLSMYTNNHGSILHFQCEKCRNITIADAGLELPLLNEEGYVVKHIFYNVKGLCETCVTNP